MAGHSQNSSIKALMDAQNWVCHVRFMCNYALGPRHTVNKAEKPPDGKQCIPSITCIRILKKSEVPRNFVEKII